MKMKSGTTCTLPNIGSSLGYTRYDQVLGITSMADSVVGRSTIIFLLTIGLLNASENIKCFFFNV